MQSGKMERHLITCAKRYLRQQFLPDVILSIPVAWLQVGLSGQIFCDPNAATEDADSNVDSTSLSLVRLPRLLRILRLLRIMKVLKLFDLKIFDVIKHIDPNVIALGKIMSFVIVFCHFLACIWWLVKRDDPDIKQWYDQLNVAYPSAPVMEQYVSSLYFIITTLTTVGYGDIHGTTDNERVFLVCVMFGGTLIFATIISSASQIVANLGASSNRHNAQLKTVFTFCKKWNVPGHQSNLVIDYCDAVATVDDENMAWDNVFMDLPHSIQSQITIAIVKNFFADNPLLSKASTKFLCVFFALVKQIAFLPSQVLCDEGSCKEPSIYFIKSGIVRLLVVGDLGDADNEKPGTVHVIKDYNAGEMVGLVSTVLWQPSLGTAISVGQTHCFVLPQSQLLALFRSFPDFERDLLDLAMSQFVAHSAALKSIRMHEQKVTDEQPNLKSTRRLSVNLQSAISFKPAGGTTKFLLCKAFFTLSFLQRKWFLSLRPRSPLLRPLIPALWIWLQKPRKTRENRSLIRAACSFPSVTFLNCIIELRQSRLNKYLQAFVGSEI
jgi:CRP-like cAMP-binding protein